MNAPQVLVLVGNDEVAIQQQVQTLRAQWQTDAAMNLTLIREPQPPEQLHNALNALPFFGGQRLTLIATPSKLFPAPTARTRLLSMLETLPPSTRVVLYEVWEERHPERHWLARWAKKQPHAEARILTLPRDMSEWIRQETRRQGGEIHARAARRLAELVGDQPRHAAQEIAKLITYVDAARPITLEDVETLSVSVSEASIFALVDALGQGNARRAQQRYHQILRDRDAFQIFGMIVRQFRLLLQARALLDQGAQVKTIQDELQLHPFVAEKITRQARNFRLPTLENIYRHLQKMDVAAKTGQMPLELAIDLFIARFA